ncbi:MAG: energy transducer TonB [Candidatus Acidiferrales bacterium]
MADTSVKTPDSHSSSYGGGMRLTRLAVDRTSLAKSFFSNLRDFLVEHPKKVRAGQPSPFLPEHFGDGPGANFRAWLKPLPAGAKRPDSTGMLVPWAPGFSAFWTNLSMAFGGPKVQKGVDVPDIWTKDTQFSRVQALSLAIHVVVLVLILVPLLPEIMSPHTTQARNYTVTPLDGLSPYMPKLPAGGKKAGGGGGGGEHNPIPASRGRLPKASYTQLAPPSVHPPANPRLQVPATILAVPDIKLQSPNLPNYGDPMAKLITDSNGTGGGGGIGTGQGTGVGSGDGAGVGPGHGWNTGGGYPSAGTGGYGIPECLFCPQPQFSDEAVKSKYMGTVTLQAIITADGRATDIHVVQGAGMGLDEKAIEGVRTWRFRPAVGPDGKPATVRQTIEVTFRLY